MEVKDTLTYTKDKLLTISLNAISLKIVFLISITIFRDLKSGNYIIFGILTWNRKLASK